LRQLVAYTVFAHISSSLAPWRCCIGLSDVFGMVLLVYLSYSARCATTNVITLASLHVHLDGVKKPSFSGLPNSMLIKLLPALMLFLSFALKLTIVFLYFIYLQLKRIVFNLSLTLLLLDRYVTKTAKFHLWRYIYVLLLLLFILLFVLLLLLSH